MNLSKIHHIAIIVFDYEAAKDFYVNKLGFSVIRENYRPERKDMELREDILQELKEQKQKAIYNQEEWLANELWCLIEVYNIHKNYLATTS